MRSVRWPREFESMVRRLAVETHPVAQRSIFPTMRDLVCFAAALGFELNRRIPLTGPTEEIDGRIMERSDLAVELVHLIALCETRSVEALLPEREEHAISVFEEYAAGGLDEIRAWTVARPDDERGDQAIVLGLHLSGLLGAEESDVDGALGSVSF